jgi:acetyl esterase/lipase
VVRPCRAIGALVACCAPVAAAAQEASTGAQPLAIEGAVTYVYRSVDGVDLRLHAFAPLEPMPSSRPAIVFFFGGGWTSGSVLQFVPQARHLAQRGMVAFVADYRVWSRHGTGPFEAMADARSAIRWVRARAPELAIDGDRIVAAGGSAGGHIALASAVLDDPGEPGGDEGVSANPDALVLFNPAVDPSHVTHPLIAERFGERGREGSPLVHLRARLPPTLILHGTADATIPYADVVSFCGEATRLGGDCRLVGYEGAGHGFFNPHHEGGKWHRETLLAVDRFLTELGYLSPPAASTAP